MDGLKKSLSDGRLKESGNASDMVLLRELALFAGAGGGILGGILSGFRTVCAVEIEPYCRQVLLARQRDGILPKFPIWDDVRTFSGTPWNGHIDVITGGFPCQDISSAGKRAGIDGERSGLWREYARIIGEVRPRFVFIENSPHIRTRGLVRVLKDLAALGYDANWGVLGAHHVGAPHRRNRMWIVAYPNNQGKRKLSEYVEVAGSSQNVCDTDSKPIREQHGRSKWKSGNSTQVIRGRYWDDMPNFAGMDDGNAHRLDRIRSTGNAQVPEVARLAWETLTAGDVNQNPGSVCGAGLNSSIGVGEACPY